jgi:hypothetical protein
MSKPVATPGQAHVGNTPYYPMAVQNGFLTAKPDRRSATSDVDHSPRLFERYYDTGFQHVQLLNGLQRRTAAGLMGPIAYQDYLSQAVPIIPGQRRDSYGGFAPKRGIDPQSYAQLWSDGPGSQPSNPGGPGKIAADTFINPGTM